LSTARPRAADYASLLLAMRIARVFDVPVENVFRFSNGSASKR
jgi:DNA-binding XRE family transcriptional regulator